jgi:nicotinate-nucleotide adenylyltransferase
LKIGILGGTFDPVHRGHTYLARWVLEAFDLSRVDLMVSRIPPHKKSRELTDPCHRHAMLELALDGEDSLYPSGWELDQPKPSYTIETMDHFRSTHPENEYCFLAGSDSLQELHLWKDYARLLEEHCLIFLQRPGSTADLNRLYIASSLKPRIRSVSEADRSHIRAGVSFLISLDAPAISSSSIRTMLTSGKEPSPDILSPAILRYIRKHRLYEK